MAKVKAPYIGSEVKINVNIEPLKANIGKDDERDITMAEYDFSCEFFTNDNHKIPVTKAEMLPYDENNYIAKLDTTELVYEGYIKVLVTAHIPDDDFADGLRTEKILIITDQYIYNELFNF